MRKVFLIPHSAFRIREQHIVGIVGIVGILSSALDTELGLNHQYDDLVLVATDERLLRAARAEGLETFNPEKNSQAALDALLSNA